MANKIKLARGTKSKIETVKSNLENYELVYSTDTDELGVKKPDGDVKYIGSATGGIETVDWQDVENKPELQDKLVAGDNITIDPTTNVISASGGGGGDGIDLNTFVYMNYAADIYHRARRQSLFSDAWEHSLAVDPSEIAAESSASNRRGTAQYPNGETEGVIIPQGVTSIGVNAFANWSANNQPLVITNSVISIGNYAFTWWESNTHPLVIPDSVTSIGERAFDGWVANTHPLVIPDSVTSIEKDAFATWRANNQPLIIPNSVTEIGSYAFTLWTSNNQPLMIPESVTKIETGAFRSWEANNHPLIIPNSVTRIAGNAFENWSLVQYVEMQAITPPTLLNANAFAGQNDAPIYVPDGSVTAYKTANNWVNLADRIFPISDKPEVMDDIADLQENKQDKLVAGDNITIDPTTNVISASGGGGGGIDLNMLGYMNYAADIYYRARRQSLFSDAWEHSLTVDPLEISATSASLTPKKGTAQYPNGETEGVIIPHGVETIGRDAFSSWTSNNQPLVIPNSVTSIGGYAFDNWTSNNQPLVIPDSVTSIDNYAFRSWVANTHPLVIPDSVTSIEKNAFRSWTSNNHPLVIPNSVTSIGSQAFYYWEKVPRIEIKAVIPPSLSNSNAFAGQNDAPIYVPDESVDDYKTATNWVSLASRIFSINDK